MPDIPLNLDALVSLIEQVQEAIDHVHLDPREFFDLSDVLYHLKAVAQPVVSYVPDAHALRKAVEAVHNETCGAHGDLAHIAVNAYVYALAAQPEVNSVESIPAKMRMLMWEGGEVEVGEIPNGFVLVGFEMETDRAWSMADKVTINIERPEVKP